MYFWHDIYTQLTGHCIYFYMIRQNEQENPAALTDLSSVSSSKPTFAKLASYTFLLSLKKKR